MHLVKKHLNFLLKTVCLNEVDSSQSYSPFKTRTKCGNTHCITVDSCMIKQTKNIKYSMYK